MIESKRKAATQEFEDAYETKSKKRLVRFTKKEEKEMRPTSRSVTLQTEIKSPRATSKARDLEKG